MLNRELGEDFIPEGTGWFSEYLHESVGYSVNDLNETKNILKYLFASLWNFKVGRGQEWVKTHTSISNSDFTSGHNRLLNYHVKLKFVVTKIETFSTYR